MTVGALTVQPCIAPDLPGLENDCSLDSLTGDPRNHLFSAELLWQCEGQLPKALTNLSSPPLQSRALEQPEH